MTFIFLQVFLVEKYNESSSCDDLYFRSQVFFWQDYKIVSLKNVKCDYSRPNYLYKNNWYQTSEKLARNSLFFSDSVSHTEPDKGVKITQQSASLSTPQPFLSSSLQPKVKFPWTSTSGFTVPENIFFTLGSPDRSAVIWGIRFLPSQLVGQFPIQVRLRYSFYKDVERGSYDFAWYGENPNEIGQTAFSVDIVEEDLDSHGVYYFKDKNDPTKPMIFVASMVMVFINNIQTMELNFDLIGTFFDFETAVDGKHSDNKTDNFLNIHIGQFWMKEDGSETSVTTTSTSEATSLCDSSCSAPDTVYIGARRISDTSFKCMCLDRRLGGMVARSKYYNALYHYDCTDITPDDVAKFDQEPKLLEFFNSTLELLTTLARDNDTEQRPNLCNPKRVANLATLYLSVSLGLGLSSWISSFYYDPSHSYVFPNNSEAGPSLIYPPVEVVGLPQLEQVYWTILSQYSSVSEPSLRAGRGDMFCRVLGVAVHTHCVKYSTGLCSQDNCLQVWKYFVESCNRVRSLNPAKYPYYLHPNHKPASYCLADWTRKQGYTSLRLYSLSRSWDRGCPELKERISEYADTSQVSGWLGLVGAQSGFFTSHRIPGTAFRYKCSRGFTVSTDSNPEQVLVCLGSRLVDFSAVSSCVREYILSFLSL